jgi:hypothetical protein
MPDSGTDQGPTRILAQLANATRSDPVFFRLRLLSLLLSKLARSKPMQSVPSSASERLNIFTVTTSALSESDEACLACSGMLYLAPFCPIY